MDEIIKIIGQACLKYHDSGETSVNREARLILKKLEDKGYKLVKIESKKINNMLSKEEFDKLPKGEIFATGILPNSPKGIFMVREDGKSRNLRWVAKNGGFYDWAIYCHWENKTVEWVSQHGDKVYDETHIRRCVPCTDEVFKLYRY